MKIVFLILVSLVSLLSLSAFSETRETFVDPNDVKVQSTCSSDQYNYTYNLGIIDKKLKDVATSSVKKYYKGCQIQIISDGSVVSEANFVGYTQSIKEPVELIARFRKMARRAERSFNRDRLNAVNQGRLLLVKAANEELKIINLDEASLGPDIFALLTKSITVVDKVDLDIESKFNKCEADKQMIADMVKAQLFNRQPADEKQFDDLNRSLKEATRAIEE